uniref:Rho-GAP domain-containing protein n=1 Tax=Meloidogyne incognita TaxID=6306 RepID=A0A914NFM9_MELIC
MPLNIIQSKTEDGSPLPRFVHDIMEYIEGYAHLTEWLFRKNGVKGRIEEIKDCCSELSPNNPIPPHLLSESQIFDLCDALKLFFRSLPECLFTNKVSSLLQNWLRELPPTYSPKHFQIAQYSILILPAENREALLFLLRFLCGIARHSNINKMNSLNLATCWMPSIFQFFNSQPLQQKQQRQNSTIPLLSLENGGNGIRRRLMRRKTIEISLVNVGGITNLTTTKENTSPTLQNKQVVKLSETKKNPLQEHSNNG